MENKTTKYSKHGTVYYLKKNQLHGCPMEKKGGYDKETCGPVEEAPEDFKKGHETVLKRLGANEHQINRILSKINYY